MEISLSFVFVNDSQAHFVLCCKIGTSMRTYAIWRGVCHDLKEILWVTNFLLYLSNMLTTVVVKELRFY